MTISMDNLNFHPLTPQRWDDFVTLFGPNGAYGGCWCMFWRETRQEFSLNCRNQGADNREALHTLVNSGVVPGILGYRQDTPLVWCSVAPREDYVSLERSRNLKRLDAQPVWSIVCFYIAKSARNSGLMTVAIRAAVAYAGQNGARIVEAYPNDVHSRRSPGDLYMGNLSAFLKAGFSEMETRGAHKIVRLAI
jgi:RimJ/RimL family protein N-acetyltransferase